MGRNAELVCCYCEHVPRFGQLIAIVGWGVGELRLTVLACARCGIGEYIPDHGRVVSDVHA